MSNTNIFTKQRYIHKKQRLFGFLMVVFVLIPLFAPISFLGTSHKNNNFLNIAFAQLQYNNKDICFEACQAAGLGTPCVPFNGSKWTCPKTQNTEQELASRSTGILDEFAAKIISGIGLAFLGLSGTIAGFGGKFLNMVINITIVDFDDTYQNVPSIEIGWRLLRDTANILFIFILLYISIGTILRLDKYNARTLLVKVIVTALLINFSLFFTKVIIDASNFLTLEFFRPIAALSNAADAGGTTGEGFSATGFAGVFMDALNLETIYDIRNNTQQQADAVDIDLSDGVKVFIMQIAGSIFLLISGFVFIAGGIFLVARYVILVLLLVTSPVGFLKPILPQIGGKMWWDNLWNNSLFPIAYMLLSLLGIMIVLDPGFANALRSEGGFAQSFLGGSTKILINFTVVIGFMIAALVVSKKLSSSFANKMVGWAQGKYSGAFRKLGGVVGRNTVGRLARKTGGAYDSGVATIQKRFQNYTPKSWTGRAAKWVAGTTPVRAGLKATDRTVRDGLRSAEQAKYGAKVNLSDVEKAQNKRDIEIKTLQAKQARERKINEGLPETDARIKSKDYDSSKPIIKDYLEAVLQLSNDELSDIFKNNLDRAKNMHFAAALSQRQIDYAEKLADEGELSRTDFEAIKDSRTAGLNARLNNSVNEFLDAQKILKAKPADVAKLHTSILKDPAVASQMSAQMLREIAKSNMSQEDKDAIKKAITDVAEVSVPTPSSRATQAEVDYYNSMSTAKKQAEKLGEWFEETPEGKTF